jgi:hypothetical protein
MTSLPPGGIQFTGLLNERPLSQQNRAPSPDFTFATQPDYPPTVKLDVTFNGKTVTMKATADDNKGVTRVEFFVDWVNVGTRNAPPYEVSVDLANHPRKYAYLYVRAFDGSRQFGGYEQRAYSTVIELGPEFLGAPPQQTPPQHTLAVDVVGNGTVNVDPHQVVYVSGQVINLTAVPDSGWQFAGWSGAISTTDNPTSFTINSDASVTATFTQIPPAQFTLTLNTQGEGSVSADPVQPTYSAGQAVTLTATPSPGWVFTGWSGGVSGAGNPATITISADTTVTATFAQAPPVTNVTSLLRLDRVRLSFGLTPNSNAPAGVLTLAVGLTNISSATIGNLFFRVTELTGGNVLLNADGGPGGEGATLTVPPQALGSDGLLQPNESFTVQFRIGLQQFQEFSLAIEAFGLASGAEAGSVDESSRLRFTISNEELASASEQKSLYLPSLVR